MVTTTTGLATSFITFSRPGATGGGATVTDSDGKIKWAGHNLLTNSESFDASAWTKSTTAAATVTANTSAAPNSTTTADRVVGAAGLWFVKQNISQAIGQKFTFGVWVKSNTGSSQTFRIYGDETTTISANLTATTSWQLFTLEFTASQAGSYAVGVIADSSQTAADLLVWGAYCHRSDLGGMVLNPARGDAYYPTTPRNLLGNTEDFSAASWTKNGTRAFGSGSIANAIVAPNGLQTADKIVENTASGIHEVYAPFTAVGGSKPYCFTIYAKAAEKTKVQPFLNFDQGTGLVWAVVNLLTGVVEATSANVTSASAIPVGDDGWYRVSLIATSGAATLINAGVQLSQVGGTLTYTGDGTSGIYLWGAQLSDSASLDAYSPVYGAAVTSAAYYAPRLDFNGSTLAPLGLLVEEQRTNLFQRSEELNFSPWVAIDCPVTADQTTAPSGVSTADRMLPNTTSTQHYVYQSATLVSGQTYTVSVYAKPDGYKRVLLRESSFSGKSVAFDVSTGAVVGTDGATGQITAVGNGWYRCAMTFSAISSASTVLAIVVLPDTGTNWSDAAFAADGTSAIFAWGAQCDSVTGGNAPFATSYIPTGAAQATRNADVASVSTQAFPYSASEGTVVANFVAAGIVVDITRAVSLSDGTNRVADIYPASGGWTTFNGTVTVTPGSNNTATAGASAKFAAAYKSGDYAAAMNGGTVGTASTSTVYTATKLSLGANINNATFLNGWVRQITYIPRRLSNSELQARTV